MAVEYNFDDKNIYDSWAIDKNGYHKRMQNNNSSAFQEGFFYSYVSNSLNNDDANRYVIQCVIDTELHDNISIDNMDIINFEKFYVYFGNRIDDSEYVLLDNDYPVIIGNDTELNLIAQDNGYDVLRVSDKDILITTGYTVSNLPENYMDLETHIVCVCYNTQTYESFIITVM